MVGEGKVNDEVIRIVSWQKRYTLDNISQTWVGS
jgi:hypothetical protein